MSENDHSKSRRRFLRTGTRILPLISLPLLAGTLRAAESCADPDENNGLRAALAYTEQSADAAQACGKCTYFSDEKAGCGHCQIFNGPANAKGHCTSWSRTS